MDDRMTAQEVADWLNVSRKWVYQQTKSGQLPAVRIGRIWFYSRATLTALVTGGAADSALSCDPLRIVR